MTHGSNWRTFPGYLPNWVLRLVDPYMHALTTIGELHRAIHDGMVFNWTGKTTGLVTTGVAEFLLVTGDREIHLHRTTLNFGAGDIDVVGYGGVTTSADGTEDTSIRNVNTTSTNTTPSLTAYSAPTVTDTGDLLHTQWVVPTASGTGQSQGGLSGAEAGEEWILKPNTKYLWRITNNSGATISYSWDFLFYDVTYVDE